MHVIKIHYILTPGLTVLSFHKGFISLMFVVIRQKYTYIRIEKKEGIQAHQK